MARQLIRLDNVTPDMDLDAFAEGWAKSMRAVRDEWKKSHADVDLGTSMTPVPDTTAVAAEPVRRSFG